MRYLHLLIFILIIGCNDVNEDKFIVEYIQHAKKENFSDLLLNDLITKWISSVNMMSNQPIFAEILMPATPLGKVFGHHAPSRENFVWAIGFNSMISRNDFWSEWDIKKLDSENLVIKKVSLYIAQLVEKMVRHRCTRF